MEWDNFENKITSIDLALESEKNITKNIVVPELLKLSDGERLLSKEEMLILVDKEKDAYSEALGLNGKFLEELYNFDEGINNWWTNGVRNELLEMAKYSMEKDVVLSKHFEDYLEYLYLNNNYRISFFNNDWFNETCEKFKEMHYAEQMVEEFKDIVPSPKDITDFIKREGLMDQDFEFSESINLYVKGTKNYQLAELVTNWDERMIQDYADFVIKLIDNEDPDYKKHYDQINKLEKKFPENDKSALFWVNFHFERKQAEENEETKRTER